MAIYCNNNNPSTISSEIIYPKKLTESGHDQLPTISPDGNLIAFISHKHSYDTTSAAIQAELWIMNKDGSGRRPLITVQDLYEYGSVKWPFSWSNKSDEMVVTIINSRPRRMEIWRVTVGGIKKRLSSQKELAENPQYSPDCSKLAYITHNYDLSDDSLYIAEPDFTNPTLITVGIIENYTWNNNSKELLIALYNQPTRNYELWKTSIDGINKINFSNTNLDEINAYYSYDSKYIVYTVRDSENNETVYITTSDIFHPEKVMDNAGMQKWVSDANLLLIYSDQKPDPNHFWTEPWIIDTEGNIIKKVVEGKYTSCDISPDGDYFAYTINGNIWIDTLPE